MYFGKKIFKRKYLILIRVKIILVVFICIFYVGTEERRFLLRFYILVLIVIMERLLYFILIGSYLILYICSIGKLLCIVI